MQPCSPTSATAIGNTSGCFSFCPGVGGVLAQLQGQHTVAASQRRCTVSSGVPAW